MTGMAAPMFLDEAPDGEIRMVQLFRTAAVESNPMRSHTSPRSAADLG